MSLSPSLKAETRLTFKRNGFAAILFAMIRPRDAKAAAVDEKTLTLTFAFRSMGVGRLTVLLLGRYRHIRPLSMSDLSRRYPGLRISYRTVHGSKGLEADYVVVLGLCSGRNGFPSEITDDPLLDLVLAAPEGHPNAEERRLFYVAITRAKRRVFLVADGGPPSSFVKELIDNRYDVTVFGQQPASEVPCPKCVNGRLQQRENARTGSTFYGCSY